MATKVFSSRADEAMLAYGDARVRQQFGMSYGQYCGTVLLDAIGQGVELPQPVCDEDKHRRKSAVDKMRLISAKPHNVSIGQLDDDAVKDLIASRYA